MAHHEFEQSQFCGALSQEIAATGELALDELEFERHHTQYCLDRGGARAAANEHFLARQQRIERQRLREIRVAASAQAPDAFLPRSKSNS